MRRRDLLALVAGVTTLRPRAGAAQQTSKVYRVGVLVGGVSFDTPIYHGFREQLRALGYVEGQNLVFDVRTTGGHSDRFPKLAEELIRAGPDVIVAPSTPAAVAAHRLTTTIPIVFMSADPIVAGLATSLARPGGNATGLSMMNAEVAGKRVELLREALPALTRVAVLWAAGEADPGIPMLQVIMNETEVGARVLGIPLDLVKISGESELEGALETIAKRGHQALIVLPTPVISVNNRRVAELSVKMRLAAIGDNRNFADAGGLLTYGTNYGANLRSIANYVGKILKGERPADLPVEQATKFELVINLNTAKALGLTVPQSLLARADEVIE
jgi:putative tryptophan/tyrosine transport system substrate-binding protein